MRDVIEDLKEQEGVGLRGDGDGSFKIGNQATLRVSSTPLQLITSRWELA